MINENKVEYYNVEDFAALVGVHENTVYYHIARGNVKLPLTISGWNARPKRKGKKNKYLAEIKVDKRTESAIDKLIIELNERVNAGEKVSENQREAVDKLPKELRDFIYKRNGWGE
jgi:transposase